jgi:solute carrier family 25 protein 38
MDFAAKLNPVTKAFLAGSFSGTCSTLLFQPLDLVKTRQQSLSSSTSMVGVARNIVSTDRMVGLWRGVIPSICRTVPGVGLYFSSMHWMKSCLHQERPSTLQAVFIGGTARAMAASAMIPFTVLKTRFESERFQYRGVISGLSSILKSEGSRGLCRGLVPTLVRDVPFSGLYLACYESLKSVCPPSLSSSSPTSCHLLSGLGAGILASLITHPADVVKTKMQLGGSGSAGVVATVSSLYRQGGLGVFTVGLAPRLLRRTVMAAMAWTLYERMLTTMSLK